jgi:ABC-type branched-subunit amino acid transport system ATPase component
VGQLRQRKKFEDLCQRMGYRLYPDMLVSDLSIGQRQMVAIFQALATGADLIVLDEPTASLALDERDLVYNAVRACPRWKTRPFFRVPLSGRGDGADRSGHRIARRCGRDDRRNAQPE